MIPQAITLQQLNERISDAVAVAPGLSQVWVVAETSDVRVSGGHCYMELIDKDPDTGRALARLRATVWARRWSVLSAAFLEATGRRLESDMKVMVCVSVGFHPLYGLTANITDINPDYTAGDLAARRRRMIAQLQAEGILDQNRSLPWPAVAQRVAVISAGGAAGYGDFINQLYTNRYNLRFETRLFKATMQGDAAAPSIIAALEAIAASDSDYDCVVIIRGGGSTGDLAAFDDYALAANIAMFPLPVIIGIGHERDITLLDYVANMRVKTPTAAAEWLIGRGADALAGLQRIAQDILSATVETTSRSRRRLDFLAGQLPLLAQGVIDRNRRIVGPQMADTIAMTVENMITRRRDRLKSLADIVETLSPEATLRRGFSITRLAAGGHAITGTDAAAPGTEIVTTLAHGLIHSVVSQEK